MVEYIIPIIFAIVIKKCKKKNKKRAEQLGKHCKKIMELHLVLENITAFEDDYPLSKSNNGIYPTEDCCEQVATYICNEYDNNPACEGLDEKEYQDIIIDSFFQHLELSDGDYDNTNDTYRYFEEEVKRYINEYRKK